MPFKTDYLYVHLISKVFDDAFEELETNHAIAAGHPQQDSLNGVEYLDAVQGGIEVFLDLRRLSLIQSAV